MLQVGALPIVAVRGFASSTEPTTAVSMATFLMCNHAQLDGTSAMCNTRTCRSIHHMNPRAGNN